MEQGTQEWFEQRLGKVTASRIADVVAKTKSGYSTSRGNYASQLLVERLTGKPAENFVSTAMQWGTDCEPQARAAYAFETDSEVVEVGFVNHPSIEMSGASPDGLIGDEGLIEIKCPNTATHIDTLLGAAIDGKYIKQMQWQMACTGRKWCDFMSFDPRLPSKHQMKILRVERDDNLIAELEREVVSFLQEIDEKIQQLDAEAA